MIQKKRKKHDKIVLLTKEKLNIKLNTIEVLFSEDLTDSKISHYEFVSMNNVLKEFEYMKEAIKNRKDF